MVLLFLAAALSLPELVLEATPSVVQVISFKESSPDAYGVRWPVESKGTGIMGIEPGIILTNHHLVAGSYATTITLGDGRLYPVRIIGSDPIVDLAVLSVPLEAWTEPLPYRNLAALPLQPGEDLAAIGFPFGLDVSVSKGIVSATERFLDTQSGARWGLLQTDIPINPGLSGGALFDNEGRIVAMAVGRLSGDGEGIGFGIPIDRVMEWVDRIKNGTAQHATLGIGLEEGHLPPEYLTRSVPPRLLRVVTMSQPNNPFTPGDLG
ncbi:serine protease, partial [bacterium]|nr:serine protease [bacterium]